MMVMKHLLSKRVHDSTVNRSIKKIAASNGKLLVMNGVTKATVINTA